MCTGGLAQMVERALSMREAVGSIPTSSKSIVEEHGENKIPEKIAAGKIDWPPANFYYYCTVPLGCWALS